MDTYIPNSVGHYHSRSIVIEGDTIAADEQRSERSAPYTANEQARHGCS